MGKLELLTGKLSKIIIPVRTTHLCTERIERIEWELKMQETCVFTYLWHLHSNMAAIKVSKRQALVL